jgi:hypothetical protein
LIKKAQQYTRNLLFLHGSFLGRFASFGGTLFLGCGNGSLLCFISDDGSLRFAITREKKKVQKLQFSTKKKIMRAAIKQANKQIYLFRTFFLQLGEGHAGNRALGTSNFARLLFARSGVRRA